MSQDTLLQSVKSLRISDFNYPLPDEKIARHPLAVRDACRLLLSDPARRIFHRSFSELPALLPPSSLLVCNDTRVINARMAFFKPSGARIEIFLLEPSSPADYALAFQAEGACRWKCLVGNLKRWKEPSLSMEVTLPDGTKTTLTASRLGPLDGNAHEVEFSWDAPGVTFATLTDAAGKIPIPPYLRRDTEDCDATDYQTVYSRVKGSVAAPTAGLHFTPAVLDNCRAHNIEMQRVTLHVGAGTFQPVKSELIGEHPMHTETFTVSLPLVEALLTGLRSGRTVTAVGTTSVRTLESLPYLGHKLTLGDSDMHVGQWDPYSCDAGAFDTIEALEALRRHIAALPGRQLTATTAIMIAPGFTWRITGAMVTNFHQPQSTLLLLVSAFLDRRPTDAPQWKRIYREALDAGYRFLSYGDACLFFPAKDKCPCR